MISEMDRARLKCMFNRRLVWMLRILRVVALLAFVALFMISVAFVLQMNEAWAKFILAAIGCIVMFAVMHIIAMWCLGKVAERLELEYARQWRDAVVPQALDMRFDEWHPLSHLSFDSAVAYGGILAEGAVSHDAFEAETETLSFQCADVTSPETDETTGFKGQYVAMDSCKAPSSDVFVCTRHATCFVEPEGLEEVAIGNPTFDERFLIMAGQRQDAFYVFTPQSMELLLCLPDHIDGDVAVLWRDGCLHLAMNSNADMFEAPPSSDGDVDVSASVVSVATELDFLTMAVSYIDLGTSAEIYSK